MRMSLAMGASYARDGGLQTGPARRHHERRAGVAAAAVAAAARRERHHVEPAGRRSNYGWTSRVSLSIDFR